MLWHGSVLHSFLWLNNIPLNGRITFCLSINQLMNIWVVSIFWLLWVMLLWRFLYKFCVNFVLIFRYMPWHGIAGPRDNYIIFWGAVKLFSIVAVPFYIPTSNAWGFQFLYILTTPTLIIICIFYYSCSCGCKVASHCGFDLHFIND